MVQAYLGIDAMQVQATVLQGGLLALVPLSILFGAFFFASALRVTQVGTHKAPLRRCAGPACTRTYA